MTTTTNTIKTVWPDALALAHAVAHFIVTESNKTIQQKEYFTIALSGGSTPKLLFQLLAVAPYRNNIPWKKIIFAYGDERFVSPDSDESNYKMSIDYLFSKVPVPRKNILAVPILKHTPAESAKAYESQLKKFVSRQQPFDMVLLGIGEEGHTASIFPSSPLLAETKSWVKEIWVAEKQMDRISFTMSFIKQAKNIVFLVSGQAKAVIVKKIFSKSGAALPAAQVKAKGNIYWFLDEAANGNSF